MRTLWTRQFPGPIDALGFGDDGRPVVVSGGRRHGIELELELGLGLGLEGVAALSDQQQHLQGLLAFSTDPTSTYVQALLDGTAVHRARLDSAITALASAPGGTLVLVGTIAGAVHAMVPPITPAQAAELLRAEEEVLGDGSGECRQAERAERAAVLYQTAASATFAIARLRHLAGAGLIDGHEADRVIAAIARESPHLLCADPVSAFDAAESLVRVGGAGNLEAAVQAYQAAASSAQFRSAALHAAGDCFRALGAAAAADVSYRAAAASGPNEVERQAVYDLAVRLEARGLPREAAAQYELLLPWGAGYRDIQTRHARCRSTVAETVADATADAVADAVAEDAAEAVEAAPGLVGLVHRLDQSGLLPTTKHTIDEYGADFYEQFENTAVQDSVKKRLEMIRLLGSVDVTRIETSLDVGSGTLRYPQVLARYGVRSYGIDLRDAWVRAHCEDEWKRRFAVADGTALPFRDRSFDLITCMMGTVNHLTGPQRARFFAESLRTLRPGGRLVLSVWDPRCVFQALLSFYSAAESAELRAQLIPAPQLTSEVSAAGFAETTATPFCTFPDWMVVSRDQPAEGAAALAAFVELDHLHAQDGKELSGQLFLLCARRSPEPGRGPS